MTVQDSWVLGFLLWLAGPARDFPGCPVIGLCFPIASCACVTKGLVVRCWRGCVVCEVIVWNMRALSIASGTYAFSSPFGLSAL